jgi:hypothetical protein
VAIGDGLRRLTTDFYRDAVDMGATETLRVKSEVFAAECTSGGAGAGRGDGPVFRQMGIPGSERHCRAFGVGDVKDPNALTPWEKSCRGEIEDGRLRVTMKGDLDMGGFLQDHSVVLETAIMGMFHYCCAHVVNIVTVHGPEPRGDDSQVVADDEWSRTRYFDLVYRGYCQGNCTRKPVDNFANFRCSLKYGFKKRHLPFPITDVTDPDWASAPDQKECPHLGHPHHHHHHHHHHGHGQGGNPLFNFIGMIFSPFVDWLGDPNGPHFKWRVIAVVTFLLVDVCCCFLCVWCGIRIANKRHESNHWIEACD